METDNLSFTGLDLTPEQRKAVGFLKIAEAKENGEWVAAIRREQVDIIPEDLENMARQLPQPPPS